MKHPEKKPFQKPFQKKTPTQSSHSTYGKKQLNQQERKDTSWKDSSSWYDTIVGEKGHFYHQELIFPKLLGILQLQKGASILDLGSGQGVLSRQIDESVSYTGIDFAKPLIEQAKSYSAKLPKKSSGGHSLRRFIHHDLTLRPWPLSPEEEGGFTHIISILALQNMSDPKAVLCEASRFLHPNGMFVCVLNHPCFRIPRKSRWGFDEPTKTQTRELFSYMSFQEIPITTHPGKVSQGIKSDTTWSYHLPLSDWSRIFQESGFIIEQLEEWVSPKISTGKAARWENRAREEFPLFLTFVLRKHPKKL